MKPTTRQLIANARLYRGEDRSDRALTAIAMRALRQRIGATAAIQHWLPPHMASTRKR